MPKAKKGQKNNRRKAKDDNTTKKLILATAIINILNSVISLIEKIIDYIK